MVMVIFLQWALAILCGYGIWVLIYRLFIKSPDADAGPPFPECLVLNSGSRGEIVIYTCHLNGAASEPTNETFWKNHHGFMPDKVVKAYPLANDKPVNRKWKKYHEVNSLKLCVVDVTGALHIFSYAFVSKMYTKVMFDPLMEMCDHINRRATGVQMSNVPTVIRYKNL